MLVEELKPAIHSKHRRMLINEVVLCHDNAEPHMAAVAIEVI
jgi:hypothetical protein